MVNTELSSHHHKEQMVVLFWLKEEVDHNLSSRKQLKLPRKDRVKILDLFQTLNPQYKHKLKFNQQLKFKFSKKSNRNSNLLHNSKHKCKNHLTFK